MALVGELKASIGRTLREEIRSLPFLARGAVAGRPSTSIFRRLVVEPFGRQEPFDVKRDGLRPLVEIARLFAMQLGYLDSTNTTDRFRYASTALPGMSETAENALDAHTYLSGLRLGHHLRAVERGENLDNRIDPSALNGTQRSMLQEVAVSATREAQDAVARRYAVS